MNENDHSSSPDFDQLETLDQSFRTHLSSLFQSVAGILEYSRTQFKHFIRKQVKMVTEEFLEIGKATSKQLANRSNDQFEDPTSTMYEKVLQENIEQHGDVIAHKSVEAFQSFYKRLEEKLENFLNKREDLMMEYNKLLFTFVHPKVLQDKAIQKQLLSHKESLKKDSILEKEETREESSVTEKVSQLKDRLQAKKETIAKLRESIDNLREEVTSLRQEEEKASKKTGEEIESLQKQLQEKNAKIRDLRNTSHQLEQVIKQTPLGRVYSPIKKLGYATYDQIVAATGIAKPHIKRYVKNLTNTPLFRTEGNKVKYTGKY